MRTKLWGIFSLSLMSCVTHKESQGAQFSSNVISSREQDLSNACYQSMCNGQESLKSLLFSDQPQLSEHELLKLEEIKTLFHELRSQELDLEIKTLESISCESENPKLENLSSQEQIAAMMPTVLSIFGRNISGFDTILEKDSTKFLVFFNPASEEDKQLYPQVAQIYENIRMDPVIQEIFGDLLEIYQLKDYFLEIKYGSLEKAEKFEIQENKNVWASMSKLPRSLSKILQGEYEKSIHKVRVGKNFTKNDLLRFAEGVRLIKFYLRASEILKNESLNFSVDYKNVQKNCAEHKEKIVNKVKNLKSQDLMRDIFYDVFKRYYELSPIKEEKIKFQKRAHELKESMIDSMHEFFSDELLTKVRKKIQNTEILPPLDREEILKQTLSELLYEIGALKKESANINSHVNLISKINEIAFEDPEDTDDDTVSNLLYENLKKNLVFSDVAYTSGNFVRASWMSVASGGGDQVVRHEIGHKIAFAIAELGFQSSKDAVSVGKLTSCLNSLHYEDKDKFVGEDFPLHTRKYFSEDFADFIAFVTGKEDTIKIGCFLDQGQQKSLINQDLDDPHSSPLFRALHQEIVQRRALSEPCQTLISEFHPNLSLRNCMLDSKH